MVPAAMPRRQRFAEVLSGERFGGCALTAEGAAYCWAEREAPRPVPGNHRFAAVVAQRDGYCGYAAGGSAHC
jgi:hypothetical protein